MKRQGMKTMVAIVAFGGLLPAMSWGAVDRGGEGRPPREAGTCCEKGEWQGPFGGRGAKVLGLSDAQRQQIKAIITANREKMAPLREKMKDNRRQIREATRGASFDEAAVRALAAKQGELMTEMVLARAHTRQQVNAVLTPEQRQLAEKIRPLLERPKGRGMHRHGAEE